MTEKLLTYEEVSELTGLGLSVLYKKVKAKQFPHIRLGPRFVRFRESDILKWIDDRFIEPCKHEDQSNEN